MAETQYNGEHHSIIDDKADTTGWLHKVFNGEAVIEEETSELIRIFPLLYREYP